MASSSLPEELVEEILVRLPQDDPVHLVRASLVCKSWRRVLSDQDCFLRRCRGFHGAAPPLLGYFAINRCYGNDATQFVPATSTASPVRVPAVDHRRRWFLPVDCRHGRVLIHYEDRDRSTKRGFVVWDPLTGSRQHLGMPSASYPSHSCRYTSYTGAVVCAKAGCDDDHLDCQAGPFRVVCVETNLLKPVFACATSYSSVTGAWSAPVPNHDSHDFNYYCLRSYGKQSLLVGDAVYFLFQDDQSILRYDLGRHRLSEIGMPPAMCNTALMKTEGGGLGLAALPNNNRIHIWSRHDEDGCWVEHRVVELETLLPRRMRNRYHRVVGSAEGTNTVFVNVCNTIFMLDVKSNKVRKFSKRKSGQFEYILPYLRFYAPS
ncbi:F-box domain containing protein [Zea mays]|jgi:hypothetical protein|uniref:F-box domain containing protein n=2 Tax=Zea mays TaxID=4577 RepID=B6TW94_MAIZE|nr:F-box domain containing protein [Zea mays]ACG41377.1 F-box domain containing protein [Zea mays]AQK58382.1 F-box domain containing protein [Zea mays]|eukprot:NP_001151035.1 F-box domain containing protein [Zea mays]